MAFVFVPNKCKQKATPATAAQSDFSTAFDSLRIYRGAYHKSAPNILQTDRNIYIISLCGAGAGAVSFTLFWAYRNATPYGAVLAYAANAILCPQ